MSVEPVVSFKVLERAACPRNYGPLEPCDGHACITGPCGDTMEFWLKISEGHIVQVSFTTTGCGSSRAAGSMATELATGMPLTDALDIQQSRVLQELGGLPKDSEHCALLAANTLKAAIQDYQARNSS